MRVHSTPQPSLRQTQQSHSIAICPCGNSAIILFPRRNSALWATIMRYLAAVLALFACAALADAGDYCYRNRAIYYDNYTYSYHQSGYWQGRWYPAGNYAWTGTGWYLQNYGYHTGYAYAPTYERVKVVYKEVEPDYYASVNSFYRDSLLADAIAYRVLTAQKTGAVPTNPTPSLPPYGEPEQPTKRAAPSIRTAVSPVLSKYVSENCLKCHNGPGGKGGVDLSSLETLPVGIRWACHGTVSSGEMPKGGKEAPDEVVRLFYEHARAASKQPTKKED